MLIKISIPIHNFYRDGVFYQDVYLETDHSPSKDEVLTVLLQKHEEDSQQGDYMGDWMDCVESVNSSENWPFLGFRQLSSNTFVHRDDLKVFQNHLPLSMNVITPHGL